jgi:hypothetical protein
VNEELSGFAARSNDLRDVTVWTRCTLSRLWNMADCGDVISEKSNKRGGRYCVAGGPNNTSCKNSSNTPNISFHKFPNDKRKPEWVRFVQRHRPGWQPTQSSVLCSVHFKRECYTQRPDINLGDDSSGLRTKPWLNSKTAVPSIDTVIVPSVITTPTARERRQVSAKTKLTFTLKV